MAKCTCYPSGHHKWAWKQNVTKKYQNGRYVSFTEKGVYKCACGEGKYGEPKYEYPPAASPEV